MLRIKPLHIDYFAMHSYVTVSYIGYFFSLRRKFLGSMQKHFLLLHLI